MVEIPHVITLFPKAGQSFGTRDIVIVLLFRLSAFFEIFTHRPKNVITGNFTVN